MKLAELERIFYEAVRSPAPPPGLARVFVGTPGFGAARRMGIYHSAYWARQERTLSETFPHVSRALGEHDFRRLAREYLARYPSAKPAIEFVGERFPEFVATKRAELPSIVPALAELEWARTDVLLAPDPAVVVRRDDFAGLELWRVRAAFARHVRVLRLSRQALAYAAGQSEANAESSEDEAVCTVVYRRNHRVWHAPFDEPEGRAIELAARGRTFAEVCEAFGNAESVAHVAAKIGAWIDKGWLERLEEGPVDDT